MDFTIRGHQGLGIHARKGRAGQASRRIFCRLFAGLTASVLMTSAAMAQNSLQTDWQQMIDETRSTAKLVGFGGAVMIDGEIVARGASGLQRKGSKIPITTANKWHVGSITKSMTATMIARLVEAGHMSWTDTPTDIFPDMAIDAGWGEVTLEHLLTHTSGAGPNIPLLDNMRWPETVADLRAARLNVVSNALSSAPKSAPGAQMTYSNLGYTIAGVMAEHATGQSWEALMRAQVFKPLGLTSAGFGAPIGTDDKSEPWGHIKLMIFKLKVNPDEKPDNSPIMGPAGTVHMSADDMLAFGNAHLQGMKGQSDYLTAETFQKLHTPRLQDYAFGWVERENRDWAGGPLSWHNGTNKMWYGFLALAPAKNMVIFTGTNDGAGVKAEGEIVKALSEYVAKID